MPPQLQDLMPHDQRLSRRSCPADRASVQYPCCVRQSAQTRTVVVRLWWMLPETSRFVVFMSEGNASLGPMLAGRDSPAFLVDHGGRLPRIVTNHSRLSKRSHAASIKQAHSLVTIYVTCFRRK